MKDEFVLPYGVNGYAAFFSLFALCVLWVLWRLQRSEKKIDFMDLLIDASGKASWSKMTAIGGWFAATFAFLFKTIHHELSDEGFLFYNAICTASPIAFAIISMRAGQGVQQMPSTTTTVQTDAATVKVQSAPP